MKQIKFYNETTDSWEAIAVKGEKGDPGTTDFNNLTNRPDLTLYALKTDLYNYASDAELAALQTTIPTKMSHLENDRGYALETQVPINVSQLVNDMEYININAVPTKTSELENDKKFVTENELELKEYITDDDIPTKVSAFENDKNYVTDVELESKAYITQEDIPTKVSAFENDKNYVTDVELESKAYITQEDIPTKVSAFENDKNYVEEVVLNSKNIMTTIDYNTEITLGNEQYQFLTLTGDTTITLPTLEGQYNHEMHLYIEVTGETLPILSFANVTAWQMEPELHLNTVCEFIFTWIAPRNMWLGGFVIYSMI